MIKKLDHEIVRIIERNLTKLQQPTPLKSNFEFLPVKCKLLHWSKISSKKIREPHRVSNTIKRIREIETIGTKKIANTRKIRRKKKNITDTSNAR